MISDENNDTIMEKFSELLFSNDPAMFKSILELLYNKVMLMEREYALNAKPYERTASRTGFANGYKDKKLNTRVGKLQIKVPQVRDINFYPQCLDKGSRSEKALKLAIAEMYIQGVSTRKIAAITEQLCGFEVSSTQVSRLSKELDEELESFRNRSLEQYPYIYLDASYFKVRHNGTVIDMACLIACGVNSNGYREILGNSVSLSEASIHWREFLQSLQKRGLHGTQLITSDDHPGLKDARKKVFPSVPWQRCQYHMSQNAQSYAPNKILKSAIGEAMRDVFQSPTREIANMMIEKIVVEFEKKAPEFVSWLQENIEEGLTCYNYPKDHRPRIRTSNMVERLNREIKRRTNVAVLFPNKESLHRLITALLSERHEEWITSCKYLNIKNLNNNNTFKRCA